jgi:hypothetical protein
MARRKIIHLLAPLSVEAIREIEPSPLSAYRNGGPHERLTIRISEVRPDDVPYVGLATMAIALIGVGIALLSDQPSLIVVAFIPHVAANLFSLARKGAKPGYGYCGDFRLEGGLVYGRPSADRDELVTELARVKDIHIREREDGINLVAEMRDGEERVLAERIARIDVARYLAKQIAKAAP